MPNWKHELRLKELWKDRRDEDRDENAKEIAPEAARRVMALSKSLTNANPLLASDLEEISDGFECVPEDDTPSEAFNVVLSDLYDIGDRNRIWIA